MSGTPMRGLEWHTACDRHMYAPTEGWRPIRALMVRGGEATEVLATLCARREGEARVGDGWEYEVRYESPAKRTTVTAGLPEGATWEDALEALRGLFEANEGRGAWLYLGTREQYGEEFGGSDE